MCVGGGGGHECSRMRNSHCLPPYSAYYRMCFNFRGVYISRILSFSDFSRFNIRKRPCFAIAQEPDLNFHGSKLSRMASNPRYRKY